MTNIIDMQQFLIGKIFCIPSYQRDYAWTIEQVDDLFGDVQEALDVGSSHYLGTFVLADRADKGYDIVDGQQCLTTVTLMIQALLEELAPTDRDRIADEMILLRQGHALKIDFGKNADFIAALFAERDPMPGSAGQRKLKAAYAFTRERARALSRDGGTALVKRWLMTIKTLEIIQFVAADTGRAIRLFQTVNDRGLPLTTMDKAKALLIFYSNRYLGGALDEKINICFGQCFAAFDSMREYVAVPGFHIDNIARDTFSEDDILRYHYLAYTYPEAVNAYDFNASTRTVFDGFLKGTLKNLAKDIASLQAFIDDYITDLSVFSTAFRGLIDATTKDERLYKLFVVLGLSARLYPLIIRLYARNMLFASVPGSAADLLHCLEVCDIRVYKTRGTDPARGIGDIAHRSRIATAQDISDAVKWFILQFMPDGSFQVYLGQNMYNNGALTFLLLTEDEQATGQPYTLAKLVHLVTNHITREHIIAQTPNWSATAHGFTDDIDYESHVHTFGNLTLLSEAENSRCGNKPVHTKMTDSTLYGHSMFAGTRQLAQDYATARPTFNKADVASRTQKLANMVMAKWSLW